MDEKPKAISAKKHFSHLQRCPDSLKPSSSCWGEQISHFQAATTAAVKADDDVFSIFLHSNFP